MWWTRFPKFSGFHIIPPLYESDVLSLYPDAAPSCMVRSAKHDFMAVLIFVQRGFRVVMPKGQTARARRGRLSFTWRTLEPFTGYYWPSVIEPDLIDTWSKHLSTHTDLYTFRKDFIRLKSGAWHRFKMYQDEWFSLVNRKLYMSR